MKAFRNRMRDVLIAALCVLSGAVHALTSGVVISQVYGGGGNSGATYTHDFVEIFNAGSAPVSLSGWSVQYASSAGTTWLVTNLGAATLQPGQYYLVQMAVGAGGTVSLPTPDVIGNTAMAAASGKVALVSSTTALTGSSPSSANLVDMVGYGAANAAEGSTAPGLSNTTADLRAANGCTDSNNNSTDFAAGSPTPRNTASAFNSCGTPVNAPIVASCPAASLTTGAGGSAAFSATDADSIVNGVSIGSAAISGISLAAVAPASADGGSLTSALTVAASVAAGTYNVSLSFANNEAQFNELHAEHHGSGQPALYADLRHPGPGRQQPDRRQRRNDAGCGHCRVSATQRLLHPGRNG
ncbi:MAG: lamin tail domain-containing protein [Rhodocyclaceae bacterium]